MTAGVRFGIDGIALPDAAEVRTVTTAYERAVVDGSRQDGLDADALAVPLATATFGHVIAAGRAVSGAAGPFELASPTWRTTDAVTGHATSPAGSYRDAVLAQRAAPRGTARVAPAYAVRPSIGPIDFPDIDPGAPGAPWG